MPRLFLFYLYFRRLYSFGYSLPVCHSFAVVCKYLQLLILLLCFSLFMLLMDLVFGLADRMFYPLSLQLTSFAAALLSARFARISSRNSFFSVDWAKAPTVNVSPNAKKIIFFIIVCLGK
jgi:hypothetical protein